ncbi:MAG: hypothetical protein KBT45_06375 [Bacteroidales bacterium]|nr:hypothetical protein [Candidatus Colimorpha pelethequi]
MLKKFVQLICSYSNNITINDSIICISDYVFHNSERDVLRYLDEENCIDDFLDIDNLKEGESKILKLKWGELNRLKFYRTKQDYIDENSGEANTLSYIYELHDFSDSENAFFQNYKIVLELIKSLELMSKCTYEDEEGKHIVISKGEELILLHLKFDSETIDKSTSYSGIIEKMTSILNENDQRHHFFVNEIINYGKKYLEHFDIGIFLSNIEELYSNANYAYDLYIQNYSFNKIILEISSKTIDYSQKIRSVINDAQNKLITIPSAFVLAGLTMDFDSTICSLKNIITLLSLYIFAILIQIFIQNQRSMLDIIDGEMTEYQRTFKLRNTEYKDELSDKFKIVENEMNVQKCRLNTINVILWLVPVVLTVIALF